MCVTYIYIYIYIYVYTHVYNYIYINICIGINNCLHFSICRYIAVRLGQRMRRPQSPGDSNDYSNGAADAE